jgi:ABC-type multidrug transport system ATPase subunit
MADILSDACQEVERYIANHAFAPALALLLDVCNTLRPEMRSQAISLSRRYQGLRRAHKGQLNTDDTIDKVEADLLRFLQHVQVDDLPQDKEPPPSSGLTSHDQHGVAGDQDGAVSNASIEHEKNAPVPPLPQPVMSEVVPADTQSSAPPVKDTQRPPIVEKVQAGSRIELTPDHHSGRARPYEQQQTLISCVNVSKRYRSSHFQLTDLSLNLQNGRITALVGVNGSGKTTFLRILLGEIAPDRGSIRYYLSGREERDWWTIKRQLGYVPQQSQKWPSSLRSHLLYVSAMHSENGKADAEQVEWHLHRYGLLDYAGMSWAELSGGYRTRAQLARALLTRPKLLVLDEPLAYLDIVAQDIFLTDLRALCSDVGRGVPVLITSQHISEIEGIADEIVVLDEGRCRFSGPVSELDLHADGYYFEISPRFAGDVLMRTFGNLGLEHVDETSNGNLLCFQKNCEYSTIFSAISESLKGKVMSIRNITGSAKRMLWDRSDEF